MRAFWSYTALLCALVGLALKVANILIGNGGSGVSVLAEGQEQGFYQSLGSAYLDPMASGMSCLSLALISTSVLKLNESFDLFIVTAAIALITLCIAGFPHGFIFSLSYLYMIRLVRQVVWD